MPGYERGSVRDRAFLAAEGRNHTIDWPLPLFGNVTYPPRGNVSTTGAWGVPGSKVATTDTGYPSTQLPDTLIGSAPAGLPPGFAASREVPTRRPPATDPNYPAILFDLPLYGNVTYPPRGDLWQLWDLPGGRAPATDATGTVPFNPSLFDSVPAVVMPRGVFAVTWDLPGGRRPTETGNPTIVYALPLFGDVTYPPQGNLGQLWELPGRALAAPDPPLAYAVWRFGSAPAGLPPGLAADLRSLPGYRAMPADGGSPSTLYDLSLFGAANPAGLPPLLAADLWDLPALRVPVPDGGNPTVLFDLSLFGNAATNLPIGALRVGWDLPRGRATTPGIANPQFPLTLFVEVVAQIGRVDAMALAMAVVTLRAYGVGTIDLDDIGVGRIDPEAR